MPTANSVAIGLALVRKNVMSLATELKCVGRPCPALEMSVSVPFSCDFPLASLRLEGGLCGCWRA